MLFGGIAIALALVLDVHDISQESIVNVFWTIHTNLHVFFILILLGLVKENTLLFFFVAVLKLA